MGPPLLLAGANQVLAGQVLQRANSGRDLLFKIVAALLPVQLSGPWDGELVGATLPDYILGVRPGGGSAGDAWASAKLLRLWTSCCFGVRLII